MKLFLICFALISTAITQVPLAQAAPKEVVVVDGQITVNNDPLSPASVIVENGVTNPVPVVDVTPGDSIPVFQMIFPMVLGPTTCRAEIQAPPGKAFKLLGISIVQYGELDASFKFILSSVQGVTGGGSSGFIFLRKPDIYTGTERRQAAVTQQFDNLPLITYFELDGIRSRPQGTEPQLPQNCSAHMWMQIVDAP